MQLYSSDHVPRPSGSETQGGAISVRSAVRFWEGGKAICSYDFDINAEQIAQTKNLWSISLSKDRQNTFVEYDSEGIDGHRSEGSVTYSERRLERLQRFAQDHHVLRSLAQLITYNKHQLPLGFVGR